MNLRIHPKLNYLDKLYSLKERMDFYGFPGMSIATIQDFELEKVATFGVKDSKSKTEVTENTLFQAASISKPITALMIFRLIEKGLLDLDEDANNHLKDFKTIDTNGKRVSVSIKELLSHTGGLSISGFPGYSSQDRIPTMEQIFKGILPSNTNAIMVEFNKGEYHYSGGGYTILQKVIEDVTGMDFERVAKKEVFDLLNVESSTFRFVTKKDDFSSGHRLKNRVRGKFHRYPEKAAAGLWTTPKDLANIIIELLNIYNNRVPGDFLTKESVTEIFTPVQTASGDSMGLGFFIKKAKDGIYIYHDGWNEGFLSKFFVNLKKGYGLVVMTNSDNGLDLMDEVFVSLAKKFKWGELEDYNFY
jgi:CubicO group peptidase (beta-lactamase class C family)